VRANSLLITGGAGFIGAHFTRHRLARHAQDRVVVLDSLTYAGDRRSLAEHESNPRFRFVHGDIRDRELVERLLREEDTDTLVHFAAESHVDRSIADSGAFISTNVVGTHELLCAARRVWLEEGRRPTHRFHHVSTDEVYGSLMPGDPPWDEASPYAPNSPYAASKAASDHLVRAWARTFGLAVTTSNCSNNYGPWQFPEKLIPLAIVNLLRGRPVPIYGDGANLREWLHVEDHCRGIELVLERGAPGEVYHLGGGQASSNLGLVRQLCGLVDRFFARDPELGRRFPQAPPAEGRPCETLLQFVADRPGHDRRYAVSGDKARRVLGFSAGTPLDVGLAATVEWYLAHDGWWREHC
jgi:dTDP-glucose 4,6-dehydratase